MLILNEIDCLCIALGGIWLDGYVLSGEWMHQFDVKLKHSICLSKVLRMDGGERIIRQRFGHPIWNKAAEHRCL